MQVSSIIKSNKKERLVLNLLHVVSRTSLVYGSIWHILCYKWSRKSLFSNTESAMFIYTRHLVHQKSKFPSNFCLVQLVPFSNPHLQFIMPVGAPTKVKRLLTFVLTKRCCTMLCQVSIWTGRRKIKQSKKLQKPLRPMKKLF